MQIKCIFPLIACAWLSGCGGGGGSDGGTNTQNVSVNAGADFTVLEKTDIKLAAQVSPPGGTVSWQILSGPSLEGFPKDTLTVEAAAPDVKSDSKLVLQVDYIAPDGRKASDKLTVSITSQNQLPIPAIEQTLPKEGLAKHLETIELSAEKSSDPDKNGQVVGYLWEQVSGPTLTLTTVNQQKLQFVHPLLSSNGVALIRLTVQDDEGGSASTEYSVPLVKAASPVIAEAGQDQTAIEFDTVALNASKSQSASGQFTCLWQQVTQAGQTAVQIKQPQQCVTEFVAPDVDVTTTLSFKVTVSDSSGNQASDTTNIKLEPRALGLIQDTGLNKCYSSTNEIACKNANFPGQDADLGRDSVASFIDKSGSGRVAFDYTKLNEFADELPNSATSFSCVRDNINGLIWEVKQRDTGSLPNTALRDRVNHYTWYLENASSVPYTGSVAGAANSTCPSNTNCGVQAYINEVNASNFCGGSNWRLPSYFELLTLIDFGRSNATSLLDDSFFPNLPSSTTLGHLYYWSAQTSVDGRSLSQAFILDMKTGNDLAYPKSNTAYIRLVRTP